MKTNSWFNAAFAAALFALPDPSDAFWRLPCRGRTGVARIDPLMTPGKIGDHVHVIHGSGNFGENADEETLRASNCTSCAVTQDKSAYWTPALYFKYANGTTTLVEQVGGMLAYYLLYGNNVKAFPTGFRMIAGGQYLRNFTWPVPDPPKSLWTGNQESQFALGQKALGFNCLDYSATAEASLYRHYLPQKSYMDANCPDGIRFELMFPSCWNGKDVDSSDHKSHMAYPSLVMDGTCPQGFETRLVSLFYETIWNTYAFKGDDGEFVIANGDPTGFGYHGDFIQGWDPNFLQQAVDTCTNESGEVQDCSLFDLQDDATAQQCRFAIPDVLKSDVVLADTSGLPGNVPIQSGPAQATPYGNSPAKTGTRSSASSTSDVGGISAGLSTTSVPDLSLANLARPTVTSASQKALQEQPITTSSATPTITYATISGNIEYEIVVVQEEIIVLLGDNGVPTTTSIGSLQTMSTSTSTTSGVVTELVAATDAAQPAKRNQMPGHLRPPIHPHAHRHRRDHRAGVGGWF